MTTPKPGFTLTDLEGSVHQFPTGRPSLICFVKEDCHTCNLVAPILEAFHQTWGDGADLWVLGQSGEGNLVLRDHHGLTPALPR